MPVLADMRGRRKEELELRSGIDPLATVERCLKNLEGGKRIARDRYFHFSNPGVHELLQELFDDVSMRTVMHDGANVLRVASGPSPTLSLLHYEDFFCDPFPSLTWSLHIDLRTRKQTIRKEGQNPAILHRKEPLLS